MSIAGHFRQYGISIAVYEPTISSGSYTPRGFFISDSLAQDLNAYSHTIEADGGYKSMSIEIALDLESLFDWFERGLGRHIEVNNESGQVIFEGVVNRMNIRMGTVTLDRGPLIDIVNRTLVIYSPIDNTVYPPIVGSTTETTIAEDSTSQLRYGIIEKVMTTGAVSNTTGQPDADQIRDTFLNEYKDPTTGQQIEIGGGGGDVSITLEVLGYEQFLNLYTYTNQNSGTTTVSTKLIDVLSQDPNALISSDTSNITVNNSLVTPADDRNRRAWDVIRGLISVGDVNSTRYTFGIYADQVPFYAPVPSEYAYFHRLFDNEQRILDVGNSRVLPWNILPARWLQIVDFLPGKLPLNANDNLADDPRSVFIESVTYTAPWGLSIAGGRTDTLPQYLASLGLGGVAT